MSSATTPDPMTRGLPPGPRGGPYLTLLRYLRDPVGFFRRAERRFGSIWTWRLPPPIGAIVSISDPREAKRFLTGDPKLFHHGPLKQMMSPLLGERSMLLNDDERHLGQRKLLLPAFHGDAVTAYAEELAAVAEREIARWPIDRPYPVLGGMQAIALEVILRAVFGARDPGALAELAAALRRFLRASWALEIPGPMRRDLGPLSPWGRYMRLRAAAREQVARRIDDARREGAEECILARMLASERDGVPLPGEEILDQLMSLLFAGHDTTAASLAFAVERLARHPAALERLVCELDSGEGAYLDAVIKETLRVRPVLPFGPRTVQRDTPLGPWVIPAGTHCQIAALNIHLSAEIYSDPLAFRPERWLDGTDYPPYTWLPFGGGIRRCLGASFAQVEMRVVLGALLARLRPEPGTRRAETMRAHHTMLIPSRGGRVRLLPPRTRTAPAYAARPDPRYRSSTVSASASPSRESSSSLP